MRAENRAVEFSIAPHVSINMGNTTISTKWVRYCITRKLFLWTRVDVLMGRRITVGMILCLKHDRSKVYLTVFHASLGKNALGKPM